MALKSDYKSSLHYLALQPNNLEHPFDEFLLYFSNKDIGRLNLAISETILRNEFIKGLNLFYKNNEITCQDEFKMIVNHNISFEKCIAKSITICRSEDDILLLTRLLNNSPNLAEIHASFISNESLLEISRRCGSKLQVISTELKVDCSIHMIEQICQSCPNLRVLDCFCNITIYEGDEIIQVIVQNCPFIETISLKGIHMTNVAVNALATIHNLASFVCCNNSLTSSAIQNMLQSNRNMHTLNLRACCADNVRTLVSSIGNYCGNLINLVLRGNTDVPTLSLDDFEDLCRGCPLLDTLTLEFFTLPTGALTALARHCPLLSDVTLTLGQGVADAEVRELFDRCTRLDRVDLDFAELSPLPQLEPIAPGPRCELGYPSVTNLHASGRGMTNRIVQDILSCCLNVVHVNFYACSNVMYGGFLTVAQMCSSMRSLNIDCCIQLTEEGFINLLPYCGSLTALWLHSAPITDKVLIQVSLSCPYLHYLKVICSQKPLTEVGIVAVASTCIFLQNYEVDLCDVVMTPTLALMREGKLYPHTGFSMLEGPDRI